MPFFLKIDGIKGESSDEQFKESIEVLSFRWGASHSSFSLKPSAGKNAVPDVHEFEFEMDTGTPSVSLISACCDGRNLGKAVLYARRQDSTNHVYLTWTMTDVIVTSYKTFGHGSGGRPTDNYALDFKKLEVEYKPDDPDGTGGGPTRGNVEKNGKKAKK